ncbi:hemagglutinin repeat-containing protein, partial [Salmonella enterica]|nr:hemagglutinin repeat-containing protein [Salmonella enterica]
MNHIYRVIWNAATASWQAVPENTRSHTKTKSICRAVCGSLSAMAIMISAMPPLRAAEPSVSVASGNTSAYVTGNGTTVVNINAASAAGLSHNLYNRYDVNPQGLVLNNTTPDKATWATQLAGQINANFNMKKSAQVILNEVVSANRSRLAGFTEVAGGKADVVVANPYGITCSGCGFINTDRVTLTTGKPYLSSIGALEGFRVTQGDILIQGNGMNATAQQMLDLVTRSVKLDGDINSQQLAITTGTNNYDYAGRKVTGTLRGTDSTPVYAVDSTALGGMYADRIHLTATEAGVGVRMLGDAAASAEDFVLSSAGNIELQNRLSAKRDIRIAGNSQGTKSLVLTDASLTSGRDTRLQTSGDTTLNGGAVVATGDLALSTVALTDNSTNAGRQNNNVRSAGGTLTLTAKDNAGISGTRWSSAGRWQGTFAGLTVASGTMLTSSGTLNADTVRGDMTMNNAVLQARGNLQLDSAGQILSNKKGTGHQDIQSIQGDLILHGNHGVYNEGDISADKGSVSLLTDQAFTNSGTVHAGSRFTVAGQHNSAADSLDNSGRLLSADTLNVRATSLANTASGLIQADNRSDIRARSLNNQGTWLLSNQDGAEDSVTLTGALVNSGTLQSKGSSTLSADSITSSGTLLAAGNLTLGTSNFTTSGNAITQAADRLALTTTGKTDLQAGTLLGGRLDLNAGAGFSNAGRVVADKGDIGLKTTGMLDNSGLLQAAGSLDIADMQSGGSENLHNSGKILAGGTMTVKADDIVSQPGSDEDSGWIQAGTGSVIEAASLDNQGTWLLSNKKGAEDRVTLTGALVNSGTLQSKGSSTLSADTITSSGTLLAAGNLTLGTSNFTTSGNAITQAADRLALTTTGKTDLQAGTLLGGSLALSAGTGFSNAGRVVADKGDIGLQIAGLLDNSGLLQAAGSLVIADMQSGGSENLHNSGKILAGGTMTVKADDIVSLPGSDADSGWIQAGTGSVIEAASLDNQGTWLLSNKKGAEDRVTLTGALVNSGTLQSKGSSTLSADTITSSGTLLAAGNLTLGTSNFTTSGNAITQAADRLALTTTGKTDLQAGTLLGGSLALSAGTGFSNAGRVVADKGDIGLQIAGLLDNSGLLQAAGSLVIADMQSGGSENLHNSGKILAGGTMTVKADDIVSLPGSDADSGWIQAGTGSVIEAASLDNQGTWLLSNKKGAEDRVTLTGALVNSGTLQSKGSSTLSADSITSDGSLLAAGSMQLDARGDITNNDGGVFQSAEGLTVTTAGDVYNRDINSVFKAATVDINAASLTNHGKISADTGSAGLHIDNMLSNDGQISAGDILTVSNHTGGSAVMLSNGGKMLADQLNIITEDLRNAGIIQGGGSQNNYISVQKTVVNDIPGIITISGTGGAGEMAVSRLTNNGKIQSAGNFNIRLNDDRGVSEIDNAGSIVTSTGAGLAILPAAHGVTSLNISGSMQSGGTLTVNGENNTVLALKNGGSVIADELTLALNKISMAVNSLLVSSGKMDINTGVLDITRLTPGGTEPTARIMAATSGKGSGNITTNSTFTNNGLVYSGNDLQLTAPHIVNSNTGGIITGHDLTVRANAGTPDLSTAVNNDDSTGNLHNEAEGNIYAGHDMSLDVNGILTNDGSIHTDNSMVVNANTITNKHDITSDADINITAYKVENLAKDFQIKTKWLDDYNDEKTVGDIYDKSGGNCLTPVNKCRITSDKTGNTWPGYQYYRNHYESWDNHEELVGSVPDFYIPQITSANNLTMKFEHGLNKNSVISGKAIDFSGIDTLAEFTNSNAVLLQKNTKRTRIYYYWKHAHDSTKVHSISAHDKDMKKKRQDPVDEITYSTYKNLTNSGIYAKSLTVTGMALTNNGAPASKNDLKRGDTAPSSPDTPQHPDTHYQSGNAAVNLTDGDNVTGTGLVTVADGTRVTGTGLINMTGGDKVTGAGEVVGQSFLSVNVENGVNGTAFGGINIPLPTNPNGLFVPVKEPGAHYLVESNPLFTGINVTPPSDIYLAGGNVIHGSDYLAEKLGYTPDQLGLRLGDASYENYLVKQQVIAQTGNVLLKSYNSANQQMQAFLDNSVAESRSMGLQLGMALTKEQQSHLDKDIVWMVQTEVAGKTVLTPVVYLSQATRDSIMNGSVISADEADLQLTSLDNNGGTINGSKSLNVTSEGDIKNNAGAIQGGDISLTSTEGNITNNEGDIAAGNKLGMLAKKDISNLSGSVQGGDVSLMSTEGSIVNETKHSEFGGHTSMGPASTITSTGNLTMNAGQDIKNLGADVVAGGNASLKATGDVTFDTIEDKNTTHTGNDTTTTIKQVRSGLTVGRNLETTAGNDITFAGTDVGVAGNAHLNSGNNLDIIDRQDSVTTHSESESGGLLHHEKHVLDSTKTTSNGSKFEVGGNAEMESKNDITVRGSDVSINGDASLQANSIKILDGQNTENTSSVDEESGIGMNNSLYGSNKTTKQHVAEQSVASHLKVGGNAKVKASEDFTIQGSDVDVQKDADINAKTVSVLAGRNTDKTDITTEKTAILQGSASRDRSAEKTLKSDANKYTTSADASASAEGTAKGKGEAGLAFSSTTTTHEGSSELKHTASSLNIGGNGKINADTVNLKGSEVSSGGDLDVEAKNINLLTAEDKKTSYKDTSTTRVGLMAASDNQVKGKAEAGAKAGADASALKASASAEAGVSGSVESKNSLDLVQTDTSSSSTVDTSHKGSALKSGGKMKVNASETLNLEGSSVDSDGDMDLHARDMKFKAVEDQHEERSSSSHTAAGFYADGGASGSAGVGAEANAGLTLQGTGVSAGYKASAEGEAGIQTRVESENDVVGSTTAVTSSIHSGGNMKRTAENSITDVGTQISTDGDFEQSASKITSEAAHNTSYKSHSKSSDTTRMGVYGEASAEGSAGAELNGKTHVKHEEGVGTGITASYEHNESSSESERSDAVVSNIQVKGNFKSNSEQKTSMEGTNISASKDAEINAGSLDYRAAASTSSDRENSNNTGGKLKAGETGLSLSGEYENVSENTSKSNAVVGNIHSGGDLKINTSGDTHLEGTRLSSEGAASLNSGGDVKFDAAKNIKISGGHSESVKAGLSAESENIGVNGSVNIEQNAKIQDTDVVGGISSGSGPLTIKSGGDVSMTGTHLESKKDISVDAAGDLSMKAAHDRNGESSTAFGTGLDVSVGEKNNKVGGDINASNKSSKSETFGGVNLESGGDIKLHSGKNTTLEGTEGNAAGIINVVAGGKVTQKEVMDTSTKRDMGVELGATYKKEHSQPMEKGTAEAKQPQANQSVTASTPAGDVKNNKTAKKQSGGRSRSSTVSPKAPGPLTEKAATETGKNGEIVKKQPAARTRSATVSAKKSHSSEQVRPENTKTETERVNAVSPSVEVNKLETHYSNE